MNKAIFREEDKIRRLLWCNRHCCSCGKACGIKIEIAHLPGKEKSNNINDGIPLCFDCHTEVNAYNSKHPKGTKHKAEELEARREQVYEEQTKHLVPPVRFEITQNLPGGQKRSFPDIGFKITHLGDALPVRVLVGTEIFWGDKCLKKPNGGRGHYSLEEPWNLNPRMGYRGHFEVSEKVAKSPDRLEIKVHVIIIDQYEKPHKLLPVGWVYNREKNSWWVNP